MTGHRFLQIHWLASYPAALPNRGAEGLAKRMPFGGAVRGRISSQALKRHWRFAGATRPRAVKDPVTAHHAAAQANPLSLQSLRLDMGVRSKELVGTVILPRLEGRLPADEKARQAFEAALLKSIYGDKGDKRENRQALFFGPKEIDYLTDIAREALESEDPVQALKDRMKGESSNLVEMRKSVGAEGGGLESALFGRMVTSDPASNRDAAIHVAHAMTVHALEQELDYLTAVDDLKRDEDDAGAAMIVDVELTSGLYYGYAVVDLPLLIANLGGQADTASQVVAKLVQLIATVSPGAKKGSTAPYAHAEWMLVEAGIHQPRTLANAFRTPIGLRTNRLLKEASEAAARHLADLDKAYPFPHERRQLNGAAPINAVEPMSLPALADWARSMTQGAAPA